MMQPVEDDDDIFVYMGGDQQVPEHVRRARIHKSVKTIRARAFRYRRLLMDVEFHDEIEIIEVDAFDGCRSLRSVKLLGIRMIKLGAFSNCHSLLDAEFGDKLETIEQYAFFHCNSLQSITMPSVKTIGKLAFYRCCALTELDLPEGLETIEDKAFDDCRRLRRIIMPLKDYTPMIEDYTLFNYCHIITSVELAGGIHKTVASLPWENWRNEMTREINRINQVLPNTYFGAKAEVVQEWIRSIIRLIDHYKAEHQIFLIEATTLLELALWKANLDDNEGSVLGREGIRTTRRQRKRARKEICVTSGSLYSTLRSAHYAAGGITDCVAALLDTDTGVADDLSNQACLLALARGKPGVIRVGGGENYDKTYRAVLAENEALGEDKYHLVGGAAGTVSPMGWTFQGGNAATMGGRMYGMGVDQVLQVEMVLPNGQHVKFGPTEWEDASAEGFAVPRTTVVSGVCRSNPDEQDEEKWIWGNCPEDFDIDFGDLWFAVRGGGGGTWGVVTSVTLQLQDILPYKSFHFSPQLGLMLEECSAFSSKFDEFHAKYLMRPSLLNVTKEHSIACGSPSGGALFCYGEEDVMQAWTNFLELNNATDFAACIGRHPASAKSYALLTVGFNTRFPDKVVDLPSPSPTGLSTTGNANVLVPQSWIDQSEENIDTLLKYSPGSYFNFGVATFSFSDQANSLPQTLREAAVMSGLSNSDYFWSDLFPEMFDISDKTKFPAVYQSNHHGPSTHGPLKDDWTKGCPLEWTFEERKEKCISAQEAIYGTELLRRLEAIKMKVDPDFMFNCISCVGNNLDVAKAPEAEVQPDEPSSVDEPSGASFASAYAAAISATVLYLCLSLF